MSTAQTILQSYPRPRHVARSYRDAGADDGLALSWLITAALLFLVAQMPGLSRELHLAGTSDQFYPQALGRAFGVMTGALLCYGLAALSHLIARALGGQGRWLDARLALFWSLLAASPLVLLHGLVAGFIGPGVELTTISVLTALGFLWIWANSLIALEKG